MTIALLIALMTLTYSDDVHDMYQVKFAELEEAQSLLTTEDAFTGAWSDFDIDSRMGKAGSTKAELLDHIKAQVLAWSEADKTKINTALRRINDKLNQADFHFDIEEVTLIKTTAKEEGGAGGYTRGKYIVISEGSLGGNEAALDGLLVHELFHVISRSNPTLRENLYNIIGFQIMEPIEYPDVLKPYRITNPDAVQTDSYILLDIGAAEKVPCMMILYAKKAYEGGSFFNYLNIGFLELDKQSMQPLLSKEGPVIHGMSDAKDFFDQVGKNTQYIIHPEEIMAENFSFAILGKEKLVDENIVNQIHEILGETAR